MAQIQKRSRISRIRHLLSSTSHLLARSVFDRGLLQLTALRGSGGLKKQLEGVKWLKCQTLEWHTAALNVCSSRLFTMN